MKTYLKIAWRNLWRNKRRTILTILSVFFAVFLALLMRSMQLGSYDMMVESAVKTSTGYIQVHEKGYWDDKSINNTMETSPELENRIDQTRHITQTVPRLESFALASSGEQTKGIAVFGTNFQKEAAVSGLDKKVIRGSYLETNQDGVLVAEDLAAYLKLDVGDSVVLLSQGYHGITAAGEYEIAGILQFTTPAMNSSLIYMGLPAAQYFYGAPNRLTSISIMLDDQDNMQKVTGSLNKIDPENLEVMTWNEMLTEIVQQIQSDNIGGKFMLGILYLVVGFGIFGTIMMMTVERKKEFGIMVAVGMRRVKLSVIIFFETIIIGVLGIILGITGSLPVIFYLHHNPVQLTGEAAEAMKEFNVEPILPFLIDSGYFINQAIVVLALTLIAVVYPLALIKRFRVISALRSK